jgi:acetyl-CoA acetyltransferase
LEQAVPDSRHFDFEMIRRNSKRGIATLCLGGGNAVAMAIER